MIDRARIRTLRESLGYTQAVLAAHWSDHYGGTISPGVVARVEAEDGYTPSLDRFTSLAAVLGVGISELVIEEQVS